MKVAYILNSFPVLYNSFTVNEMLRVSEKSVEIIGFALKRSHHKTFNENSLKIEQNIHYICDYLPGLKPNIAMLVNKYGMIIKRHISKSLYNSIGKLLFKNTLSKPELEKYIYYDGWNVFAYERIAQIILNNKVDVIHAGFGNRPATAAMVLSQLTGIPFTFEGHAYDLFVDFPFKKEKIQLASKIFTISNYNKSYLINELGCMSSKVSVIRVPINQNFCETIPQVSRKEFQLVSVCRLHPIKGLSVAIEAIATLVDDFPDIRLILIGNGSLESELQQLCKKFDILKNVIFYGSAGNEEALKIVSESAIFVLPSVIAENGDRDGIPTSLIEAMYLKTPVISTTVSGIPELIEDGVEGYLVEPRDVYMLSDRIKKLVENKQLRKKMGERGKQKIRKEFYSEDCEDVLIREWSNIIS